MKKLLAFAAAAAAACMTALPASAGLVSVNVQNLPAGTTSAGNPLSDLTVGLVFENVTGSDLDGVPPNRRDPWEGTAEAGTGVYTSISAGSSAHYTVDSTDVVTLIWGSPDTYNKIVFDDGTIVLGSMVTSQLAGLVPPGTPGLGAFLVTIVLDSSITGFTMSSTQDAFEFANLAVPVPGAALLLLSGLAGLGFASRRKKAA